MQLSTKLTILILTATLFVSFTSPARADEGQCWVCPEFYFEAVDRQTCCKRSGLGEYCAETIEPTYTCNPSEGETCLILQEGNRFSGICIAEVDAPTPTPDPGGPGGPADDSCNGGTGIKTGLGCIPTDPTGLVNKILQIAIGVSSGIALLLLISGAFRVLTSSGDPKSVMEGKDTITSAIAGLLLILLSVAILNIIGIQILDIPIWGP